MDLDVAVVEVGDQKIAEAAVQGEKECNPSYFDHDFLNPDICCTLDRA